MKRNLLMIALLSGLSGAAFAAGMGAGTGMPAGGMGAGTPAGAGMPAGAAGGMGAMNPAAMKGNMGAGNVGGAGMQHGGAGMSGGMASMKGDHAMHDKKHVAPAPAAAGNTKPENKAE